MSFERDYNLIKNIQFLKRNECDFCGKTKNFILRANICDSCPWSLPVLICLECIVGEFGKCKNTSAEILMHYVSTIIAKEENKSEEKKE